LDPNAIIGSQVRDLGSHGRHGTLSGTTRVAGRYGGGLKFNGTSDYLDTGHPMAIGATEVRTFLLHVKAASGVAGVVMGVGKQLNGTWNRMQLNWSADKLRAYVRDDDYVLASSETGTETVADGKWHLLVFIVDPGGDKVELWIDDVLGIDVSAAFGAINTSPVPLNYGCLDNKGERSEYSAVTLSDLRMYSRRLSVAEMGDYRNGVIRR